MRSSVTQGTLINGSKSVDMKFCLVQKYILSRKKEIRTHLVYCDPSRILHWLSTTFLHSWAVLPGPLKHASSRRSSEQTKQNWATGTRPERPERSQL